MNNSDDKTLKPAFTLNVANFSSEELILKNAIFMIGPMTIDTGSKTITIDPDYTADNAAREVIEILKKEFFGNVD